MNNEPSGRALLWLLIPVVFVALFVLQEMLVQLGIWPAQLVLAIGWAGGILFVLCLAALEMTRHE